MSTVYPTSIDTTSTLPSAVDNSTPVEADVVNRLRDSILAVESELGVKPSSIYTTVRNRLDVLETLIATGGGGGGITFGGDLNGNSTNQTVIGLRGRSVSSTAPSDGYVLTWVAINNDWEPQPAAISFSAGGDLSGSNTNQTVIGFQGRPFVSTAPTTAQAIIWDGSSWSPESITEDIVLPSFSISLFGGGFAELGQTINNPAFTASYNRAPATAVLTDTEGDSQNVISTPTSFSSIGSFTKTVFADTVTFTLTATDAINTSVTKTSNATLEWVQLSFYGTGPAGQSSEAFIESLTGVLNNVRGMSFSVNAGPTEKVYFACRAAYGGASFSVGGFSGGFFLVSNTISVTNFYGVMENYELYESDNLGLGSITVTVS